MIKYTTESGAVYWVDTENKYWLRTEQSNAGTTIPNDVWLEYDWFHEGKYLVIDFGESYLHITTDIVSKEEV